MRMQEMTVIRFLVAIFLGLLFLAPAHSQSHTYVNPVNERHTISIQLSPELLITGDRATEAAICPRAEKFVCISSVDFNFSFPMKRQPQQDKWEHRGHAYTLQGSERLQAFGRSWRVWIVESVQGPKTIRFAYSEERGLLAFSIALSDTTATFLSVGTVGFGARSNTQLGPPRK